MRLKLLISFAYPYDYSKEIIVAFTVEGQVSRDDERYLFLSDKTICIETLNRIHHEIKFKPKIEMIVVSSLEFF